MFILHHIDLCLGQGALQDSLRLISAYAVETELSVSVPFLRRISQAGWLMRPGAIRRQQPNWQAQVIPQAD